MSREDETIPVIVEDLVKLDAIMAAAHELAELAWPDKQPEEATRRLIGIQMAACRALDMPEDLPLRVGDGRDDYGD